MAKTKPISFELIKIDTPQFAVFEEKYEADCQIQFNHEFGVGADDVEKVIHVRFEAKFLCEGQVFIVIEVLCTFQIDGSQFDELFHKDDKIKLPKDFIIHLIMLTIGITRGTLYEKLRSTTFGSSDFYLPAINLKELVVEDVVLEKE